MWKAAPRENCGAEGFFGGSAVPAGTIWCSAGASALASEGAATASHAASGAAGHAAVAAALVTALAGGAAWRPGCSGCGQCWLSESTALASTVSIVRETPSPASRNATTFCSLRCLSSPLEQPWGFQNQAHGRHCPEPCKVDPFEGRASRPGGGSSTGFAAPWPGACASESRAGLLDAATAGASSASMFMAQKSAARENSDAEARGTVQGVSISRVRVCAAGASAATGPATSGDSDSWPAPPVACLALDVWSAIILATLSCLRRFSSPGGHKWQWLQFWPFSQPFGFQNQAQGLHCPVLCQYAPRDGRARPPIVMESVGSVSASSTTPYSLGLTEPTEPGSPR
mmetsp:Transcript_48051/g.150403  ORF Transcript_48051/g.150403 Transcript_48051/m.150403 type:complete len:343 (-) Transcript_48051:342-1370(-)